MTMPRSRFFREDFDRGRDFIAKKSFLFGGKAYVPGQVIDKTKFSVRRLRQLYDQRYLDYPAWSATEEVTTFITNGGKEPMSYPPPLVVVPEVVATPTPRRRVIKRRRVSKFVEQETA